VHFVFGGGDSQLTMGHYTARSRRVIDVRECPVHADAGNALAFQLKDAYARARITAAPQGTLKSLAIRVGHHTPELMATLVVTEPSDKRLRAATRAMLERPGAPTSFHLNVHPRGDAFVFGRETRRIAGPERMRESVAGVSFLLSPTAFFQTNVRAAESLVRLVRDAIPAGARVLDLYAGVGLFALPLARDGHHVVAVEENRTAVADGEASLRLNAIPAERCRFVARRAEDAIGQFTRPDRARSASPDAVVLDPPREGCSPSVIQAVFHTLAPARAVYVSCNPEALARDLGAIVESGYRIESLQPVDMFPHTEHVETVAVLSRRPGVAPVGV
jgi:23S rRNA (uracil1939-C5)-methyltransferase